MKNWITTSPDVERLKAGEGAEDEGVFIADGVMIGERVLERRELAKALHLWL